MTLHKLVERTNWMNVWDRFALLYPNLLEDEHYYYKVYTKLRTISPREVPIVIVVDEKASKLTSTNMVKVLGVLPNNEIDFAIEFNSMEEWLGMEIDSLTLNEFSNYDIVVHCLHEMAFAGNGVPKKETLGIAS